MLFSWKDRSGECSFMQTKAEKNEELGYRRVINCTCKKNEGI
jgi:hypothetical protein